MNRKEQTPIAVIYSVCTVLSSLRNGEVKSRVDFFFYVSASFNALRNGQHGVISMELLVPLPSLMMTDCQPAWMLPSIFFGGLMTWKAHTLEEWLISQLQRRSSYLSWMGNKFRCVRFWSQARDSMLHCVRLLVGRSVSTAITFLAFCGRFLHPCATLSHATNFAIYLVLSSHFVGYIICNTFQFWSLRIMIIKSYVFSKRWKWIYGSFGQLKHTCILLKRIKL